MDTLVAPTQLIVSAIYFRLHNTVVQESQVHIGPVGIKVKAPIELFNYIIKTSEP